METGHSTNYSSCEDQILHGTTLRPEADISGSGVVLAFLLSAYITFATELIAYLSGFVDDVLLNPVDLVVFRIKPRISRHPRAAKVLRNALLILSDQQIVTGIAIMGAGFQGLRMGGISVYHFQVVVYLAWMSSSVHLAALALLGPFLRRHRALLYWRLSGMIVLLALLVVGLVPTLSNDWGVLKGNAARPGTTHWGIQAQCFWREFWGDGVSVDGVLGLTILVVSYAWRVGALFQCSRHWYNNICRFPLERMIIKSLRWSAEKFLRRRRWYWITMFRFFLCIGLPILTITEVAASFSATLWLALIGLVFGTIEVEIPRSQVAPFIAEKEDVWEFGQLVPLILLILPFGAVTEHLSEKRDRLPASFSSTDLAERSASLGPPLDPRETSLFHFVANVRSNRLSDTERDTLISIIVGSRLFACLVWYGQAGIVCISILVFYVDAFTIGYIRTSNWPLVLVTFLSFSAAAIVFGFFALHFSRLGRVKVEHAACEEREEKS